MDIASPIDRLYRFYSKDIKKLSRSIKNQLLRNGDSLIIFSRLSVIFLWPLFIVTWIFFIVKEDVLFLGASSIFTFLIFFVKGSDKYWISRFLKRNISWEDLRNWEYEKMISFLENERISNDLDHIVSNLESRVSEKKLFNFPIIINVFCSTIAIFLGVLFTSEKEGLYIKTMTWYKFFTAYFSVLWGFFLIHLMYVAGVLSPYWSEQRKVKNLVIFFKDVQIYQRCVRKKSSIPMNLKF